MKSKNNNTVDCTKAINLGHMPLFVSMIHRHFEKEMPLTVNTPGADVSISAPVDMMRLSVANEELIDDIAEVSFTYRSH